METPTCKGKTLLHFDSTHNVNLCFDGEYYFLERKINGDKTETSTIFFNAVFLIDSYNEGTLEFAEEQRI